MRRIGIFVAIAGSLFLGSCSCNRSAKEGAATPAATLAPLGTVIVETLYDGAVPPLKRVPDAGDPACAGHLPTTREDFVVHDGKLANVVVRVAGEERLSPPPAHAKVTQDGCRYVPRVQAMLAGTPLDIASADATTHNIHAYRGDDTLFNFAQTHPSTLAKELDEAVRGPILLRCDIHPWMAGVVFVTENPWFGVSDGTGRVTIDVPAGHHRIEAWHETLGARDAEVDVPAGGRVEVRIGFSPP